MKKSKKEILIVIVFTLLLATIVPIRYLQGRKYICKMFKCIQDQDKTALAYQNYKHGKWRNLSKEQVNRLSKIGRILFLEEEYPIIRSKKNYTILNWKYADYGHPRHIERFTDSYLDPFENCSVRNCKITYKNEYLQTADLVLFEIYFLPHRNALPTRSNNSNQIWSFIMEESALNAFSWFERISDYPNLDGVFNWAVNYRMDSDVPFPYGRTTALPQEDIGKFNFEEWNKNKKQDVLITMMNSRCFARNSRFAYVRKLHKYVDVDRYGECGRNSCSGYYTRDCKVLSRYKFYLAFENSNCNEYITEKVWWNSFQKNAIPIVMGTTQDILDQILPPHSYIHINDFVNPKDLADYIIHLNNTPSELRKYLEWRNYFKILNEHGYFQSKSELYCRICEALNYNNKTPIKVYRDLKKYWLENQCQRGWSNVGDVNIIF
ncbi:hypothetical protein ILUMI_22742 [Ignelater luminosus]|uniref:Fucosyltransferase n=1 Tax=Ignelater luminosus TaxID=2038154 RepID=A0A8K0CG20_IGNLU|nr:hypothetical protein ILUMI_22742 [Ignelater luminosus]